MRGEIRTLTNFVGERLVAVNNLYKEVADNITNSQIDFSLPTVCADVLPDLSNEILSSYKESYEYLLKNSTMQQ